MGRWNFSRAKIKRYLAYAAVALLVAMLQPVLDGVANRTFEAQGSDELLQAWEQKRSKVWVTTDAEVVKTLRDDNEGSRHQRFLIRAGTGETILVAHNIDLAERVPLREGSAITLRGRYEWNDKGGVIHWTHHDPSGRLRGGWVEADGKRYQ